MNNYPQCCDTFCILTVIIGLVNYYRLETISSKDKKKRIEALDQLVSIVVTIDSHVFNIFEGYYMKQSII